MERNKDAAKNIVYPDLDPIFHPRSIAMVGISPSRPDNFAMDFLASLLEFGFVGPIYPVNPSGGEALGRKVYTSLEEIPGNIDYVICTIPAKGTPRLVEQCAVKGVKAIQFFTSGFSETGETEGAKLQADLVQNARKTGVRIIGPNCMGVYCPESHLTFMPHFPRESGPVGLLMQSGGNTADLINQTMWRGVRFSKVVSYGNACDLDETDYLEYLAADPGTKTIGIYIEGIKNGGRFRRALSVAARKKIVVLLKAGNTEGGARGVASHTAVLAGNNLVWDSLCRQTGVIRVYSLPALADMLATSMFLPRFIGRRVALVGAGGGPSVMMTDEFESRGFQVPALSERVFSQIREFTPLAGNMLTNPIDFSQAVGEPEKQIRLFKILSEWNGVDFVVGFLRIGFYCITASEKKRERWLQMADSFLEGARTLSKPFAMILEPSIVPGEAAEVLAFSQKLAYAKIPVYYSLGSAAEALRLYNKS